MLLVYGDLIKATSLFLLALVSLTRGTLRTESPVCQAGGFFLQFGTETAGEHATPLHSKRLLTVIYR